LPGDDPAAMDLPPISAEGRHVVVIGGGDTGSDCIGTRIRQKAKPVINFELFPKPAEDRPANQPWPFWSFNFCPPAILFHMIAALRLTDEWLNQIFPLNSILKTHKVRVPIQTPNTYRMEKNGCGRMCWR
jgi:hypothetical protein